MNLQHVRNIIFDLGGIILNIDYSLTEKAFINLGIKNFSEVYSQAKQNNLFDSLEEGKISADNFRKAINQYVPNASDEAIDNAWNAMLLDFPKHRAEKLEQLSKQYRLFLLSNTNEIHLEKFQQIIEKDYGYQNFVNLFEKVYYSHELGLRKPRKECFRQVLVENNLPADQTLFVDDSIQHVEGAESVGIHAIHIPKGGMEEVFGLG
jgi:glucose-1-phosphatase